MDRDRNLLSQKRIPILSSDPHSSPDPDPQKRLDPGFFDPLVRSSNTLFYGCNIKPPIIQLTPNLDCGQILTVDKSAGLLTKLGGSLER